MQRSKPLYRKVNTRTHGVTHGSGQRAAYERRGQKPPATSMHSKQRHGFDYTPLYRFLLSRIGRVWEEVHSDAVARLDQEAPIYHIVALRESEQEAFVRTGESSYFSGLCLKEGRLAVVDPTLTPKNFKPFCACCTHSFNGVNVETPYDAQTED